MCDHEVHEKYAFYYTPLKVTLSQKRIKKNRKFVKFTSAAQQK